MKPVTTLLNSSGEADGQLWPWCGAIHNRKAARQLAGGRHRAPVAGAANDQRRSGDLGQVAAQVGVFQLIEHPQPVRAPGDIGEQRQQRRGQPPEPA